MVAYPGLARQGRLATIIILAVFILRAVKKKIAGCDIDTIIISTPPANK